MKKNILFILMMLIPLMARGAYSGSCGKNAYYSFDVSTMTLTISGTGTMDNSMSKPWYSYRNAIQTVVIEEGITSVGDYAFEMCDSLKHVTLPSSILKIGVSAFELCKALTSISLPEGLKIIDALAFSCTGLKNVTFPNSVTTIGNAVFSGCKSLESVIIGNKVTKIPDKIFYGCVRLSSVILGDNVSDIGNYAFDECYKLSSIILPPCFKSLGMYAFNASGLKDVYCYAKEIPDVSIRPFYNIDLSKATLHVRESEIPMYKVISPWNLFGNIVALDNEYTRIDRITIGCSEINNSYYSLDGKRFDAPHKSINIVKMGNGQTKKIIVK